LPPAPPRGTAIDVFNFGGGHCRTLLPAPPRGPAIDVFNFGGGRCQTLPPAPRRVPAIDVFNFAGGHCRTLPQAPHRGPPIDVFNFSGGRCRTLLLAPPGGLPLMSSTLMVAAAPSMLPSTFLSIDGGRSQDFSSNWPQLWVHSLSRGGPEGLCRYPEDQVP
jgi:hypothetical protein